jgi:hypothetical protein
MSKGIIVSLGVIILCAFLYLASAIGIREVRAHVAQNRGESFIQKLYADYTILGKNCQGEDTDGDSYVSCDFRITNTAHDERVVHLQCPDISKSLIGNTCKESRLTLP